MPITKSAQKALRQSEGRKSRNIIRKDKYKKYVKEFRKAIVAKNFDEAKVLLPKVYQSLDKAAKSKTIKKNKASRLKSRLSASMVKSAGK
ncbi:MAG: 30S ribosomal protein S20 [Minisyncoccia bacterium]|jgi:small subunit ribosomal protein S20